MSKPMQVLLIDDDEDEKVFTEDILSEVAGRDYQLSWVKTFAEGLEKIVAGKEDVYLIDYRLGPHSGLDILRELKSEGLNRPTIVLTGQGDDEVDIAAMEMGASDFLVKGEFDAKELDRAIRYSVEQCKGRAALHFQAEILKNVHDAVFFVSEDGVIQDWNPGAERIFGIPVAEAIGMSILEACPHDGGNHPFTTRIIPAVREKGAAEEVLLCRSKTGAEITVRAKVTAMSQGDRHGFVVCASDITEQRKLESEILQVSENEQRRIGQDIHDDLCSQLSGIGMLTKVLEGKLKHNHVEEAKLIGDITEMVADAGQKARRIAKGLVPSALETQGLGKAIHEMADQSEKLFGVNCVATVLGEQVIEKLEPGVAVQLFRIAQEATTNSLKHSDADLIQVRLTGEQDQVILEVSDDGKGMPEDIISSGLGMMTMRQRAEIIHADFELHSFSGRGTKITCSTTV